MRVPGSRNPWFFGYLLAFAAVPAWSANILSENFDNLSVATAGGWVINNLSNPLGTTNWFQGNTGIFDAQAGAPNSYAAANFENTNPAGGAISDWLISPMVSLNNGFVLSIYTRTEAGSPFPDRLQIRFSTNGASTNVGASQTSVGDFTNLLLDINPDFSNGGYPESWSVQTLTLTGLGGPVNGRIAFRYLIDDISVHGNYVGLDTFSLDDGGVVPEPATIVLTGAVLAAAAFMRRRKGAWL